ncbi:hypothetical protein HGRIS_008433 [Hohenbuehelia grisea]|uniref:F-box domain-containing protein n=1 Tax=Hohenbuehelia grisea TaxID=104357 RepID=A0ABR3J8Z4_9AGAR
MLQNSPFAHLVGTPHRLLREEVRRLDRLLEQPIQHASALDAQIANLQEEMKKLVAERDELKEAIQSHLALKSHAQRLPFEVLATIFIHCLPTAHFPVRSIHEAPLLLGRVCKSWRDASMSTPRLWSAIHIAGFPELQTRSGPYQPNWVGIHQRCLGMQAWLERSGSLPLHISIVASTPSHFMGPPPENSSELVQIARHFCHRWETLSLDCPKKDLMMLGSLGPEDVPVLQTLQLIEAPSSPQNSTIVPPPWTTDVVGDHFIDEIQILHTAPNLHRVTIQFQDTFQPPRPSFRIQWTRLTSLDIKPYDMRFIDVRSPNLIDRDVAIKILSSCSHTLESCCIGLRDMARDVNATSVVVMERLKKLHIHFFGQQDGRLKFFNQLLVPRLVDLGLLSHGFQQHPADDTLPFMEMLQRSSCSLKRLELDLSSEPDNATAVLGCLKELPSLVQLKVKEQLSRWLSADLPGGTERTEILNGTFLGALAFRSEEAHPSEPPRAYGVRSVTGMPTILPALEALEFESHLCPEEALCDLLESRLRSVPRYAVALKQARIHLSAKRRSSYLKTGLFVLQIRSHNLPPVVESPWAGLSPTARTASDIYRCQIFP